MCLGYYLDLIVKEKKYLMLKTISITKICHLILPISPLRQLFRQAGFSQLGNSVFNRLKLQEKEDFEKHIQGSVIEKRRH
jgi:hypothetical protein